MSDKSKFVLSWIAALILFIIGIWLMVDVARDVIELIAEGKL
jgi:hypothetical protein